MTEFAKPESCLFCRIGAGEIPSHIVHESPDIVAFMDINPIRTGHVQIIPKAHYPYFEDLPGEIAGEIILLGQRMAAVLKAMQDAKRVGFLFTGGDVPHAHAHVVPLHRHDDITSRRYIAEGTVTYRSTPRIADADLAETAREIARRLAV